MIDGMLVQQVALTLIPGLGPKRTREILNLFENPMEVFRAPLRDFKSLGFFSSQFYHALHTKETMVAAEKVIENCIKKKINITFFTDKEYPSRLSNCDDAPVLLYSAGSALKSYPFMISIVGTRNPTPYGVEFVQQFIEAMRSFPICIISGLAYGVDLAAHKTCISLNIPTIACVAHGLHTIYPAAHKNIATQMCSNGGVISEYPPGVFADKERFPMRNRIIAGLSDSVIIVESAQSGGSLITAHFAQQYNRDIYALPGRTTDPKSIGCNQLIKKNIAEIIQDIPTLLRDLEMVGQQQLTFETSELSNNASKIHQLLSQQRSMHMDEIILKSSMLSCDVSEALFELEINGRIHKLPGSRVAFKR
jgi:DNA processing protein